MKSRMTRRLVWLGVLGTALIVWFWQGLDARRAHAEDSNGPAPSAGSSPAAALGEADARLPLYFIENRGQVANEIAYYERSGQRGIWFTRDGVGMTYYSDDPQARAVTRVGSGSPPGHSSRAASVRLIPVGMNPGARLEAGDPEACRVSYLLGGDPEGWIRDIPTFGSVEYREAYPGIDLRFYGQGRALEYDVFVRPGADPDKVRLRAEGVQGLGITPRGDLTLRLPNGGQVLQGKPVAYQVIHGARIPVETRYRLFDPEPAPTYGFEVAAYDARHPLVIDPVVFLPSHLVYSTYLGGAAVDHGQGIAVDGLGNAYVTGTTQSADFPHDPLSSFHGGGGDAFVVKLDDSGSALQYAIFLGGSEYDEAFAVKVDGCGCAYVVGTTHSSDFPTKNAVQGSHGGGGDIFIVKVNASGTDLEYGTFLGGSDNDYGFDLALDQSYNAYVTGWTQSSDFPKSQNPYQATLLGTADVIVTQINAGGTQWSYSTYLGGHDWDAGYGIAVNQNGEAYVTGETHSSNYPHYPAQALKGNSDAFVTRLAANGGSLVFSSLVGGSSDETGWSIALDSSDYPTITGQTWSSDYPTLYPVMGHGGGSDAFVTQLTADGTDLEFSTYLGGSDYDRGFGVAVWSGTDVCVTGETRSANFPLLNALQSRIYNSTAAFVTRLGPPDTLRYSTFLGGAIGSGIAVNTAGNAFVTGEAFGDFPTKAPLQAAEAGGGDAFVAKLVACPADLSGLVAFYPFEGDARDACGRHDGVVTGAALSAGYEGQAYDFDGIADFIQAGLDIGPGRTPRLTLGCWARSRVTTPYGTVLSHDDGGYDRTLSIDNRGTFGTGWSAFNGTGVLGGSSVTADAWTFLAVVYDQPGNKVQLFVGESEWFSGPGSPGEGEQFLCMGKNPFAGDFFNGFIDNVFVFDRCLSWQEIQFVRETGAAGILTGKKPSTGHIPAMLHLLLP